MLLWLAACAPSPDPDLVSSAGLERMPFTGPLHVVLVLDITNSWSQDDFAYASEAAVALVDALAPVADPDDLLGLVVFTGQYGVEHTPMFAIPDAAALGIDVAWGELHTASKAGIPSPTLSNGCSVYSGAHLDDFSDPVDGCFPNMWREYADESGTDHAAGLEMAKTMFFEHPDPTAYRAMILLTDGEPNGTGAHLRRDAAGYVESRWRFVRAPVARTALEVVQDTKAMTRAAWRTAGVSTWAVSYAASSAWLGNVVRGDGTYVDAAVPEDLPGILEDIAAALP